LPPISAGSPDPVILIYSLAQAIAALSAAARAGCATVLASAPDAGGYAGPGWFGSVVAAARRAVPGARFAAFLDCGDNVGAALGAIRAEVDGVIFTGRPNVAERLADIARQHGVRFETNRPAHVLDLVDEFFASKEQVERRCAVFLQQRG
jgi:acyl-CoA reductase-like NAD-dependent aldehyde dehydrogenase